MSAAGTPVFRSRRARGLALLGASVLWALSGACSTRLGPPTPAGPAWEVAPGTAPEALFALKKQRADAAWAEVLKAHVDAKGAVDFRGAAAKPAPLETFVAFVAEYDPSTHPALFPSRTERLAHFVNAYNALSMYGVIRSGFPKDFDSTYKRVAFFVKNEFLVGGKWMSLYAYENDVIRKEGDARAHFALNCMSGGCPRLPREPFRAAELDAQFDAVTTEFFNDEKHVRPYPDRKAVALSEILSFYTEDFVGPGRSESLIAYANIYRKEKLDANWKVEFIPYDWTVSAQGTCTQAKGC